MNEFFHEDRAGEDHWQCIAKARNKVFAAIVGLVCSIVVIAVLTLIANALEREIVGSFWSSALSTAMLAVSVAVGALLVALVIVSLGYIVGPTGPKRRARKPLAGARSRLIGGVITVAAVVAGPRRASDAETWSAHLLGHPGDRALNRRQQLRAGAGFLAAAVRMRAQDARRQACRPLDWLVTTDDRLSWLVVLVTAVPVVCLHGAGGWAKVWEDLEQVGVVATFATAAAYGWRRIRGITAPKPKPRTTSETPDQ
ncbi:hypothetical protein [Actinoplanes aureus]|uniref:Uncharacterized protein n=1 Tax=Actinoplanes aureus TaxID=2792083 RepID=A0A931G443_9ACTN|nr:hypothetical protein [Actinoplanes aureus]MBG0564899.1 hypothetical protein [Actinoplanes aureus]MBG0569090.1 hypothetical protein [Actinoplanes aureus]